MYSVEFPDNLSDFRQLLHRVLSGEEVVISQAGTPVARIVPFSQQPLARIPGLDRGKVVIDPDFNAPLPEDILKDFLNPLDIQNESIT
ncbi:type II toxin-antitoxin system Phd/YefM family antitoxin [Anabaena sp. UHCC 0451]|uniref:type II toxin-antitoxin system Phd/YefM family antitoxin n=1 Tax=Anabaena sp. UHCC 0451 TaxID=2055235 RepID=UPI002B1FAA9D|nr:type II toxin-antitoxin system Phd/YefM family antitoxin [Anabaena sp. UHCC 0451]MEA5576890.1 type II toxin-antitoxin system Phd/YefM family antitoxin [Anabaena sp. UHCC 0451]